MMLKLKFENIYEKLKRDITALPPYHRIPPVRDLMEQFSVSQYTIDKALKTLEEEGLIHKRVGRGIYTSGANTKFEKLSVKRIVIAAPSYPSPMYDILLERLHTKISNEGNIPLIVRYNYREMIDKWIPRDRFDGLILIPPGIRLGVEHIVKLHKLAVPVVILGRMLGDLDIDCVDSDNVMCGALAANHLIELGHRKLAVMLSEPHVRNQEIRINSFIRQANLSGIDNVQIIDCKTQSGQSPCEKAYEHFSEIINKKGLHFTAIFVHGDFAALGVLKACYDNGIKVPHQLSVIGFSNLPGSEFYCPSLTTIDQNYPKMADEALNIITQRIFDNKDNQKRYIHKEIQPTLIKRESTKRNEK